MSDTLAVDDPAAVERAMRALEDGRLVVVPTDTVYAIVADAFAPQATRRLLRARGSGRNRPVPVLIARPRQLAAIAIDVPAAADRLIAEHWPGPLTLVLRAVPGMNWDLGNTAGTVAVRMPDEAVLRDLVREVGPLAGTGATRRGRDPAVSVDAARAHFGDAVTLYVDGGPRDGPPSTIVDASRGESLTVLREGAVPATDVLPPEDQPSGAVDGDDDPDEDGVSGDGARQDPRADTDETDEGS